MLEERHKTYRGELRVFVMRWLRSELKIRELIY